MYNLGRHTRRSRAISAESPGAPTPSDGRCLRRDMSTDAPDRVKDSVTTRRIAGPIPEHNRFDEFTGATYFRCRDCGAEALEREHLIDCCPEAGDDA